MNWDLSRLYRGFDDPALARDFEEAESLTAKVAALFASADHDHEKGVLESAILDMGAIAARSARFGNMVQLTLAADATNEPALGWFDRYMVLGMNVQSASSAWARYVGEMSDLDSVIASSALLMEHDYMLHQLKDEAAHTIDPSIEPSVLTMQLTGGRAFEKLRDTLDATHQAAYTLDEETRTLTLSEVRALAYDRSADVRRAAYDAEIAGYQALKTPMAACLSAIKGEALTLNRLKHYDDVLDETLTQARISRATLDAMLMAIDESLPMFRRYLRGKAKALGHAGGLPFYDLFAPLGDPGPSYTLESARALLTQVLGAFSPPMGQLIDRAFDERWIDAYPRAGKQGGAFCSQVYPLGISYVLSNFDGSLTSVSTLAHELGHAYHNEQLYKNSVLNSDVPMTLAETASIFNESLLSRTLIARASGASKLMLLDQELTEATQTVVDILSRYTFERAVFAARKERSLQSSDFEAMMREAQLRTYGDGLDEDFLHPFMWACKGHYYSPDLHFYNFPYAFGLLFGKGVYAHFEAAGERAYQEYEALLRATALGDAESVAQQIGIDLTSPDFWRASLAVIAKAVDEFERIVSEDAD